MAPTNKFVQLRSNIQQVNPTAALTEVKTHGMLDRMGQK